jgi:hypothetical protein
VSIDAVGTDCWAWFITDAVNGFVAHLALDSGGSSEVRQLGQHAVD